jgi:hypothetical protein
VVCAAPCTFFVFEGRIEPASATPPDTFAVLQSGEGKQTHEKEERTMNIKAHWVKRTGMACVFACSAVACGGEAGPNTSLGDGTGTTTAQTPVDRPLSPAAAAIEEASIDPASGEQTKDATWAESSQLSTSDLAQLKEINAKVATRRISQATLNGLTDSLASIKDQHEYFIALNAAIPESVGSSKADDEVGTIQSRLNQYDYPAGCYGASVRYTVVIQTGSNNYAGTDANTWLRLSGRYQSTASYWTGTMTLDTPANDFERGSQFVKDYWLGSPGDLNGINLWHDNHGDHPGWFVDYVNLYDSCSRRVYYASVYTWLARDEAPLYGTNYSGPITGESTY